MRSELLFDGSVILDQAVFRTDANPVGSVPNPQRGAGRLIRKAIRIGKARTSIKLEPAFWAYLKDHVAQERGIRLSTLVKQVAAATPDRTNLASTLRIFALTQATLRAQTLERERDRLALAGSSQDLTHVLEACPLPCLLLDRERTIRQLNRTFAAWLNLEPRATLGQRLDTIMLLRGPGLKEMWAGLADGQLPQGRFTATYVSPGRVCTAQAVAVALGGGSELGPGGPLPTNHAVLFEILPGRA